MRAFIALELPADFADDTAAAARRLSASLEGRFLDRSTYHLTLAFLGDIDDAEASRAMDALDVACAGSAPVSLAPDGLGKFGRPADATLWLGVAPDPALQALAERVREELTARDVPFDPKPFRPHITLGRRVRIPKSPYRHWPSRCRRTPAPSHCSRARFPATAPNTSRSTQWSWGEPAEMPTSTPN